VRWALILVAALLACTWAWTKHAKAVNEQALAAVAGQLSGRPVHVHCQSWLGQLVDVTDNSGWVAFDRNGTPTNNTDLKRYVCLALRRFRTSSHHSEIDCLLTIDWSRWSYDRDAESPCARRAWSMSEAINTLTHESMHMHGWAAEAVAQCYAIQEDAWTVMRLGGSSDEGKAVAEFILALQPGMPTEYQSGECRAGGPLDLHPETPEFPSENVPSLPPPASGR
jgi:hypothetical protein